MLKACEAFDEVVIFDNGSCDQTLEIAQQFLNVKIHEGVFKGFGPTHNEASQLASNDWILSIDSDEVLSNDLVQEIKSLNLDKRAVYAISRHNEYNGKWIKWCGWSPDYQVRLYHRKITAFSEAQVHESVIVKGLNTVKLKHPLKHFSYEGIEDFLSKMQSYSSLFAAQNKSKQNSSPFKALIHSWFAFFKSYVLKRGFLGGYEGFLISMYQSHTAFYKYLKLYERQSRCRTLSKIRRCPEEKATFVSCSADNHS